MLTIMLKDLKNGETQTLDIMVTKVEEGRTQNGNPFLIENHRFLKINDKKILGTHGFYELEPTDKVYLIPKNFCYDKNIMSL